MLRLLLVTGARVRTATLCQSICSHRPLQFAAGDQTVFVATADGKLLASGFGANGRLGTGNSDTVFAPTLVSGLHTIFISKVAVNPAGKHTLALTADGTSFDKASSGTYKYSRT